MVRKQKTLCSEVTFTGIGVHSGKGVSARLIQADPNTGIRLQRKGFPDIVVGAVVPELAMHATVLQGKGWAISTVEHLLAAVVMTRLTNVAIQLDGPEVPILDGSALPFVEGIGVAGLVDQDQVAYLVTPKEPVSFSDATGRSLVIVPAALLEDGTRDDRLFIDYHAEFQTPLAGDASFVGCVTPEVFREEIAPARTFGFIDQLPFLRKHGLALGSSLGNSVVIGQEELLNDMRIDNECVRHKVLDLIGDLGLLGCQLAGSVQAVKTGHQFNAFVVKHFLQNPKAWELF